MNLTKQNYPERSKKNMSSAERSISALAGSYILWRSFNSNKRSISKTLLGGFLLYRAVRGVCPVYRAISHAGLKIERARNVNLKSTISINRSVEDVYTFWRQLENLPRFLKHLQSVKQINDFVSVWEAKIPGGMGSIKWKSEIVKDIPNEHIGWQSLAGSAIENAGNVKFLDAGKFGTEVHIVISYHAPAGLAGEGIGRLLHPAFEKMLGEEIKNLKRILETGEIPVNNGQPLRNN